MKISSKFLLAGVLVFLSATAVLPVSSQTWSQFIALQDRLFGLELKLSNQQQDIEALAKRQDAFKEAIGNAKFDVDFLKSMRGYADTKTDDTSKKLVSVESELQESKEKLARAQWMIEMLDRRLSALEPQAGKSKTPVRKPNPGKAPAPNLPPTSAVNGGPLEQSFVPGQ